MKKNKTKYLHQFYYLLGSLIFIGIVLSWESRSMPELRTWNKVEVDKELLISKDYNDIDSYLKDEDNYIRQMFAKVADTTLGKYNRYNPKSYVYPFKDGDNMNASFVYDPGKENTKGVILLLHGLSDSPYHMRDIGEIFYDQGFYVLGLRLPGHGTLPTALLGVDRKDWMKATDWGARRLDEIARERGNVPFYMGGFSTGGALILNYSFRALEDTLLRMPAKLFLFSPAVGVSRLAIFSAWHKAISWMPYFEKLKWLDILPEYDPAKYNSFPKNAARQIYLLTLDNKREIKSIAKKNLQDKLPGIISFQSLVDATVVPEDLIDMYRQIGTSKDELFVFDVNRVYKNFMRKNVRDIDYEQMQFDRKDKPQVHIILNKAEADSIYGPMVCGDYLYNEGRLTNLYPESLILWPANIFAISHIAVPISYENKAYGRFSALGNFSVHGERGVLVIPSDDLSRIRYNPFFDVMKWEIIDFLNRK